jgi:hypothetical protein
MSPLLVSRIRPSESLSRRPIGKMRCSWPTKSTMLPLTRRVGRAGDADRLVQRDVDVLAAALFRSRASGLAVDAHIVALGHDAADAGDLAIDGDAAFRDQAIGLAARGEIRCRRCVC